MQVSTKSRLLAEWYCKYRWNVASLRIRLRVSMECRFLAVWVQVSTEHRLPAEWFCKYRWNVTSLLIGCEYDGMSLPRSLGASID
ncbi:hypothetical protein AAC387_Pa12g0462 [Persea americana]